MAAVEDSGGGGGKGVEEAVAAPGGGVVGADAAHSSAPDAAHSTSSSAADNGSLHRSSTPKKTSFDRRHVRISYVHKERRDLLSIQKQNARHGVLTKIHPHALDLRNPPSTNEEARGSRNDSMDMFRGSVDSAATIGRCGEFASNLHKMEKALRGTFLDTRSSNEITIHPANALFIQVLQDLLQSASHTNEHSAHMVDCWASELKKGADMVCRGENSRKCMFLMNNICGVVQIMRRTGASFSNAELVLTSMIQRYKKSYFDEYWVPLKNALQFNLDNFTAEFLSTCDNQRTWKLTAELKYVLRQEIVDLILPAYKTSLSVLQANRSRLSGVLSSFERVTAGKKKQKKYTCQELEEKIKAIFEG